MNRYFMRAGGRTSVRRLVVLGLAALSFGAIAVQASDPITPDVTVRSERGVYTVSAQFHVAQSTAVARAVLTDYEQIPRFMPNVRTSVVRERSDARVVVEQEAVARLMMFSKRIHLLLEVQEDLEAVRFRDASGRSFARYEGVWRIVPKDGCTLLVYELTAKPSFDVPDFVLTRLLKRDARQMIEHLRDEIASRSR